MTDQPPPGDQPARRPGERPGDQPTEQYPAYPGYGQPQYPRYEPTAPTSQYPQYPYGAQHPNDSRYPNDPRYPYGQQPQYPQYSPYDEQSYYQHPYGQQYGQPYGYPPRPQPYAYPPPPPPRQGSTARSLFIGLGAALAATALVLVGVALTSGDADDSVAQPGFPTQPINPQPTNPGNGNGNAGGSNSDPGAVQRSGNASAAQKVGVVTIVSTLKYDNALSAGTGMILSTNGRVLTNNHVIRGATSIKVTVQSTGESYSAKVVGTAPGFDVAEIKLSNASGLKKAKFAADAGDVRVGDNIVGVGNGGGTGSLKAAAGKVTALNQTITASDENGRQSEKLNGLIEVNAKIISGDSGGPLYDADGRIIGMNTAASAARSTTPTAYAIPIEDAMQVAKQIESGVETSTIHIGVPGFLGIKSETLNGQARVALVIEGLPAEAAGITRGSVITAVDGTRISSAEQLTTVTQGKEPGDRLQVSWTDMSGASRSASVQLAAGPAD